MKNLIYALALVLIVHCTMNVENCEGQWTQVNGPYGGYIKCFGVSGTNIFTGTSGGGIYISNNNGTNCTPSNNGSTSVSRQLWSMVTSGSNIFAGTGSGVYLSTDNGAH